MHRPQLVTVLIALCVIGACAKYERAERSPVPPPPPAPTDPEGSGPADVPEAIRKFFDAETVARVELYQLTHEESKGAESFHGWFITERVVLPDARAAQVVRTLTSRTSYTDHHYLCTDLGIGLRRTNKAGKLDLMIGLTCRHVHDAASGEEIGQLSTSGHRFFVQLADTR